MASNLIEGAHERLEYLHSKAEKFNGWCPDCGASYAKFGHFDECELGAAIKSAEELVEAIHNDEEI